MMNVRSSVFAKDTFNTIANREVRYFSTRGTHHCRTSTTTIDNCCYGILTFKHYAHDEGEIFIIYATSNENCISCVSISERVSYLRVIAEHIYNLCRGSS